MTEDEAKTKWCPFARPASALPEHCGEVRGNRDQYGGPDDGSHCIGSACMAWREQSRTEERVRERIAPSDGRRWTRYSGATEETSFWFTKDGPPSGHCGLAGQP